MSLDIGVGLAGGSDDDQGGHDEPFHRTIEVVSLSVKQLLVPVLSATATPHVSRLLVFGSDSDDRAQYIAERNYFSPYASTVGSPLYDEVHNGIYWVNEASELEELSDDMFDAVLCFNVTPGDSDCVQYDPNMPFHSHPVFFHLHRVLRPGGIFAGTGLFKGLSSDEQINNMPSWSVAAYCQQMERLGFFFHTAMDMSLEGYNVSIASAAPSSFPLLQSKHARPDLVCARFIASKLTPHTLRRVNAPSLCDTESFSLPEPVWAPHELPSSPLPPSPPSPPSAPSASLLDRVVVSGVAVGLPNHLYPERSVFDSSNFQRIFDGCNFISSLSEAEQQAILNQNVVQVTKSKDGQRIKHKLTKYEEVIKLSSKLGHFDLAKEYGVPSFVVETLDVTYQLAIAAGLEALQHAGIPVYSSSSSSASSSATASSDSRSSDRSGKIVGLPDAMQAETGVIFASSFPCMDSCVEEVSLCVESQIKAMLLERKVMCEDSDMDLLRHHEFDRKLLFKVLVMANNQLAELIKAKGPNTHVNSACSSTTQAIAIAHDWLRLGRCRRVIVISGDNATGPRLLPYLGTGFLALTAASIEGQLDKAACPFDKRRNGMILGMGAVGLVLESRDACIERNGRPLCELLSSQFLNSAFHASLLDRAHISFELQRFIHDVESRYGVSRHDIAKDLIYFSHETFTCASGGCAKAEIDALTAAFGEESKRHILIANTKGFTAHPMGVGLEDAIAVSSLDTGLAPPIANYKERDPLLGEVMLSPGGSHDRHYALRFAAGFGSQFTFLLFYKPHDPQPGPEPSLCVCRASSLSCCPVHPLDEERSVDALLVDSCQASSYEYERHLIMHSSLGAPPSFEVAQVSCHGCPHKSTAANDCDSTALHMHHPSPADDAAAVVAVVAAAAAAAGAGAGESAGPTIDVSSAAGVGADLTAKDGSLFGSPYVSGHSTGAMDVSGHSTGAMDVDDELHRLTNPSCASLPLDPFAAACGTSHGRPTRRSRRSQVAHGDVGDACSVM